MTKKLDPQTKARKASGVDVFTRASTGRLQAGYWLGKTFIDTSGWLTVEAMTEWLLGLADETAAY